MVLFVRLYVHHIYIYIYTVYIYQKNHVLVNKKGDVGMAKCFSKKYGNTE